MTKFRGLKMTTAIVALGALAFAAPVSAAPRVDGMPVIHGLGIFNGSNRTGNGNGNGGSNGPSKGHGGGGGSSVNVLYHGGTNDGGTNVGIQTAPKVYLVFWGSQWGSNGSNDPSGEASILENFFGDVSGSKWNATVSQYCEGISSGSASCSSGNPAPTNSVSLGGFWYDSSSAAPRRASQAQLAAEAVAAAGHFGNTTSNAQYVIATATGDAPSGFGSSYCAWHSSTTVGSSNISYTNLPYITDAGAACGANFVGPSGSLGPNAGITIVEGHEFAESESDPFPNTGWLNGSGAEIGDLCAWNASTSSQPFGNTSFPVQPLWSNAANGCSLGS